MEEYIRNIYTHILSKNGSMDQVNKDDVVIIIFNPQIKKGIFKRKNNGSMYDRTALFIHKKTAYVEIMTPSDWMSMQFFDNLQDIIK
jgi:hypothetical protein